MTDDTTDVQLDVSKIETTDRPRRNLLRTAALVPVLGLLPRVGDDEAVPLETRLVEESLLPPGFKPYPVEEPVPFARTLLAADDRFAEDDFAVKGFTEGSDASNPRYVVTTMRVTLPKRDALKPVRTHLVTEFEDLMDSYAVNPWTEWTRTWTDTDNPQKLRLNGRFQTDSVGVADVEGLPSNGVLQFEEHWGLDATDDNAVVTVVFGSRDGPWRPRTLFNQTLAHVRRQRGQGDSSR